jgi:hypothetical protein
MVKIQFKTMRHGSTEDYRLGVKDADHYLLSDESGHFQQLIKKALRWRILDMITTDHGEAVKRARLIDGSVKSIVDHYFDDVIVFYLVYGYAHKENVKVQSVGPLTLNR